MNVNEREIKKAAAWSIICTAITSTINFLVTPIFTRLLTPEEFGDVNTFSSYFIIFCTIISLQLSASISKAFFDFKDQLIQYVSSMVALAFYCCAVWFCIFMIFGSYLIDSNLIWKSIYLLLACFSTGILNIYFIYERFQFKYKIPVFITITNAVSNILLSILLIYLFPKTKADSKIVGSYFSIIIWGIILAIGFWYKGRIPISSCIKYWKYGLYFAVPNIIHTLGMQVLNQSDRLMIKYLKGSYEVGLYSIPYSICAIINTLWSSILVVINPWLYQKLENRNFDLICNTTRKLFKALLLLIISFVTIAPEVMIFLIDQQYYDGIRVMPAIAIGIFFSCMYTLFCTMENQYRKVSYTPIGTLAASIINIILNYIGINLLGYKAAAYTSAFCYILLAFFHGSICKKIEKEKVFPIRHYIQMGIICIFISILLLLLYDAVFLRYAVWLISLIILGIVWKRDYIELLEALLARPLN